MSRFCGEMNVAPLLEAAEKWKRQALLADGSVFSSIGLWSLANLSALNSQAVVDEEDGGGSFLNKLERQLSAAKPETKQLAAEVLWVMLLCPSNMKPATKREIVETVWGWSNEPLPQTEFLQDEVLRVLVALELATTPIAGGRCDSS